jgi:hypothetical protein
MSNIPECTGESWLEIELQWHIDARLAFLAQEGKAGWCISYLGKLLVWACFDETAPGAHCLQVGLYNTLIGLRGQRCYRARYCVKVRLEACKLPRFGLLNLCKESIPHGLCPAVVNDFVYHIIQTMTRAKCVNDRSEEWPVHTESAQFLGRERLKK